MLSEDDQYAPATPAYCQTKRTEFDLLMPAAIDPTGALAAAFAVQPNDSDLVAECGAVRFADSYAAPADVRAAIGAALGD